MSYFILPISCQVISCVTVQRLTYADQQTAVNQEYMAHYNNIVNDKLNPKTEEYNTLISDAPLWNRLSLKDEDNDFIEDFNRTIDDASIKHVDSFDPKGN